MHQTAPSSTVITMAAKKRTDVDDLLDVLEDLRTGGHLTPERVFASSDWDADLLRRTLAEARTREEGARSSLRRATRDKWQAGIDEYEALQRALAEDIAALSGAIGLAIDRQVQPSADSQDQVPEIAYSEFCTVLNLDEHQRASLLILLKTLKGLTIPAPE